MAQVKPIPEGTTRSSRIWWCAAGPRPSTSTRRRSGPWNIGRMPMPDGKIMHAQLKIGDSYLFLCDEFSRHRLERGPDPGCAPVTIHLNVEDADAVFQQAVAAGAKVKMPLADMFWGDRYGKLVDPFGHEWSLSTHKEDVSPEEMKKRGQAMMAQMGKH